MTSMSGVCILSRSTKPRKVKAVYSSMHFERIYMPDTYEGTAKEAFEQLTETRNRAAADLASADQKKSRFSS